MTLSTREKAYELVEKLNEELFARFGEIQPPDGPDPLPCFSFTSNGPCYAILLDDVCIWDSENGPDYDDDDNEIPLEPYVRREVAKRLRALEWVTRDEQRDKVSLDHVLWFLNALVKEVDADAIKALIETRVPCNTALADHPTVQVHLKGHDNQDVDQIPEAEREWQVGFLGILNGLFGRYGENPKKGWGQIAAVFEEDGALSGFRRTR